MIWVVIALTLWCTLLSLAVVYLSGQVLVLRAEAIGRAAATKATKVATAKWGAK